MNTVEPLSPSVTWRSHFPQVLSLGRTWRPYVVFAALAFLYFYPFLRTLPKVSDEGTLIDGAVRVIQGEVPYRDFFEVMAPGTFYWLAGFFQIFGVSWFTTRICVMCTSLLTALLLYSFGRRLNLRWAATPV